ncbi:MAG: hypothetical protein OCC45_15435 [Desulfotalea sp.]
MKSLNNISIALTILLLSLSGCAKTIAELSPPASRLTAAIQGVCERPTVYGFTENGTSQDLLDLATEDDPSLLTPFNDMTVKSQCIENNGTLMICDTEGKFKIIEDLGCTSYLDHKYENDEPCKFMDTEFAVCD